MQRCMKAVEGFAPQFVEYVRNTDPNAMIEHGLFARTGEQMASRADAGWGVGRVTLIGDAAHPMRPTGWHSRSVHTLIAFPQDMSTFFQVPG